MKWTTLNVKNPNYTSNHEIYVGTHTGSFKKLVPAYEQNPFAQKNLQDLTKLDKESRVMAFAFGNEENSEILIGRGHSNVQLHSLRTEVARSVQLQAAPVVGVARFGDQLVAGFGTGQLQCISLAELDEEETPEPSPLLSAGDDMSHMRQCAAQRNLVATGGKGRQNNLKVWDMEAGGAKPTFSSKNLPDDFLQLEVPVWDSDVGFIDAAHAIATCSRFGYVRVYDTRAQRRPVQRFASEEPQMSFATLVARGNYIYTGTTMGGLKAFDTRRMKTFVHTYKGFTGSIADLDLDASGKYLVSASLDRYVRVHHADSTALLYQCYVKSKATRVLIRDSMENPNKDEEQEEEGEEEEKQTSKSKANKNKNIADESKDDEYDEIFENMQTVCESEEIAAEENNQDEDDNDDDNDGDDDNDDENNVAKEETQTVLQTKSGSKRKTNTKTGKNKKKKN